MLGKADSRQCVEREGEEYVITGVEREEGSEQERDIEREREKEDKE